MSKVVASYDTETKELSLTIDGVSQPDVSNVIFSSDSYEDENYGYFEASFKNKETNGITYRLSASGSEIEKSDKIEAYIRGVLQKKKE